MGQVADDRREVRTEFHAEAVRIAVFYAVSVLSVDAVLVHHARLCTFGITFPEISVISFIKFPFLPVVKFPNDCNACCSRCKGTECGSVFVRVCAKKFIGVEYFSCVKSVKIHINLRKNAT